MKPLKEALVSKNKRDWASTTNGKYHLDKSDIATINEHTLYRIIADKSFGNIHKGDKGGYIESVDNLSSEGNCWITDNAWVRDNAKVYENAYVYGDVDIYDNAEIYGNAKVYDDAEVHDDAKVYGWAEVFGNAEICEAAKVDYRVNRGKIRK